MNEMDRTTAGQPTGRPSDLPRAPRITQLGRYRIERTIGVGGSAAVYLAVDTTLDKKVALKVLHEHLREDPVTIRRFTNDARALARLNHPNIVQIYTAELDQYYFAMEYVEGVDLSRLIADGGSLPPTRAISIALQMADALAHIHRQGLLHRDVKPGNILVAPGDRVKLTDFSIAREAEETMLTLKGSLVGTVEYMAPEQIREEPTDARADVYALGAVLYEMLAGRPPFVRESGVSDLWPMMERILKEKPRAPHEVNASVPKDISDATMRALEKDPTARFASMDDFAQTLRTFIESGPTVMVAPVALANPVELPDGTVRLSWTAVDSAEFDRYEVHGSTDKDFVPSAENRLDTIEDRSRTEARFPVASKAGLYFYRIKTVLHGGMTTVSNRSMIEFGYRPPFWRRREVQLLAGLAGLILIALTGFLLIKNRSTTPSTVDRMTRIGGIERATVTGRFSGAQFFPATGMYRFILSQPTFEFADTGKFASIIKGQNLPRIDVEIPRRMSEALDADGIDLTTLPPQQVSVTGNISEDPRQGLMIQPVKKTDIQFKITASSVKDIEARDWQKYENQIVRLTASVASAELRESSNTAILTLDGNIRVYISSAIKTALETKGVQIPNLNQKRVTITGQVKNDKRFGWELILARPEHLTTR